MPSHAATTPHPNSAMAKTATTTSQDHHDDSISRASDITKDQEPGTMIMRDDTAFQSTSKSQHDPTSKLNKSIDASLDTTADATINASGSKTEDTHMAQEPPTALVAQATTLKTSHSQGRQPRGTPPSNMAHTSFTMRRWLREEFAEGPWHGIPSPAASGVEDKPGRR